MRRSRLNGVALAIVALGVVGGCDNSVGPTAVNARLDSYPRASLRGDPGWVFGAVDYDVLNLEEAAALRLDPASSAHCRTVSREGDAQVVRGDCTDPDGTRNVGTARLVRDPATGAETVTFMGFGTDAPTTCGGQPAVVHDVVDGTVSRTRSADWTTVDFEINLIRSLGSPHSGTCANDAVTRAISYRGTVARSGSDADHDGRPDARRGNGSGRVGDSQGGTFAVSSVDVFWDPTVCRSEPASGAFRVTSGGDFIELPFIGATDCR
jgi:hypothetical protein